MTMQSDAILAPLPYEMSIRWRMEHAYRNEPWAVTLWRVRRGIELGGHRCVHCRAATNRVVPCQACGAVVCWRWECFAHRHPHYFTRKNAATERAKAKPVQLGLFEVAS
jgi:hypothetical protein